MMRNYSVINEVMKVYDAIATGYSHLRVRAWGLIKELGPSAGWVADVGCGPCHNGLEFLRLNSAARLICLDLSIEMLRVVKRNVRKLPQLSAYVNLIQADMRYIPFRDNVFKCMMYIASLNHIPPRELTAVLSECFRVLDRGGKALMTLWAPTHPTVLKSLIFNVLKLILLRIKPSEFLDIYIPWRSGGKLYRRYYHVYTLRHLIRHLKLVGLHVIKKGKYDIRRRKLLHENYYVILLKDFHHVR